MTSDVACWNAAFDGAEQLLGPAEGCRFVACVVAIIRALRAEREEDWSFMPASCCRVTGHECALVNLLNRAGGGSGRISRSPRRRSRGATRRRGSWRQSVRPSIRSKRRPSVWRRPPAAVASYFTDPLGISAIK